MRYWIVIGCLFSGLTSARSQNAPADVFLLSEQAEALMDNMPPGTMDRLADDDPLLMAIYAERLRGDTRRTTSSSLQVDRDLGKRPKAKSLVSHILQEQLVYGNRYGVLDWLKRHPQITWGREIMDKAVAMYHAKKEAWDGNHVALLSEVVGVFGGESYRSFFDDVEASGMSVASGRNRFNKRFGNEEAVREPNSSPATPPKLPMTQGGKLVAKAPSDSPSFQHASQTSVSTGTVMVLAIVIICALGLLWLMLRSRDANK